MRSEHTGTRLQVLLQLLLWLVVTISTATRPTNNGESAYLDHHNLGCSLRRTARVATFTNYGRMLFHFALPQSHARIPFQRLECIQTNTTNSEKSNCQRLKTIMEGHHYIIRGAENHVKKRIDQIQKLNHEFPINRRQRATRGFGADILSSITGLSIQDSVDKIITILRRVELGFNQASEAWQVSTPSFISSTKVLNTRVNNLFNLMSAETRSIDTLYTTMRNFYINANNTLNHLSHSIIQISRIMLQLNEADTLYAAVQQTVTGSLSHLLVPPVDLNRALLYLQNFLTERNANFMLWIHCIITVM